MPTTITYRRPALYQKQQDALFDPCRYVWVEASTKSGKTHGCIVWLHEQAALGGRPGRNYWWVAPINAQAKIAWRRLVRALPRGSYTENKSEQTVTLANGATIWFKSAENPDSLFGEDVYAAVVDEASRVKPGAWFAVRSTLTATRGPVRLIGNVKGRRNWFYRGARRAQAGLEGHHYARLTAYDAVEGGVLDDREVADAKATLPEPVFRELYLALPAEDGDSFFATDRVAVVEAPPPHARRARGWDFAATEPRPGTDPDWTVGALIAETPEMTYIVDVARLRAAPDGTLAALTRAAVTDGPDTAVVVEQERGAAGKTMVESIRQSLRSVPGAGHVHDAPVTGDKPARAFGLAVRVNSGKVCLVSGPWNEVFLAELDEFPADGAHDDQVDAAAHAFNYLHPPGGRPSVRTVG